ncbi:MAG: hypothetical protein GY809_20590 [Planctomycetes bacterium]|nr:hypothetical protein [Planctomycetota bacterium]
MKHTCNYRLTLCLALVSITVPSVMVFAQDCPCIQGRCDSPLTSDDNPAQCCCESPASEANHGSKSHSSSDDEKSTGKCTCPFSQITNSPTVILFSSNSWVSEDAVRTWQYRSDTWYTSLWVLKILRPPSSC